MRVTASVQQRFEIALAFGDARTAALEFPDFGMDLGGLDRRATTVVSLGHMDGLPRITQDPKVMGGRPCIRGLRMTVGTIIGLLAAGKTADEILAAYPYLERDDINAALAYAAWRTEELEVPLSQ